MNKKRYHTIYLILHYQVESITVETISSIHSVDTKGKIVVVDNGSPNKSGLRLQERFQDIDFVDIVISQENKGFSEGNNYGYEYINSKYEYDFLIATNNDIKIEQKDFVEKIDELFEDTSFFVAGPDVVEPYSNYHSSPLYERPAGALEIYRLSDKWEKELKEIEKVFSLYEIKRYIGKCKKNNKFVSKAIRLKHFLKGQDKKYYAYSEGCVLNGAFIIFSSLYCKESDVLFEPLTFMYCEEDILTRECEKKGWKIVYSPAVQVLHFCEGTSKLYESSYRDFCDKRKRRIKLLLNAYKKYLDYYKL